MTCKVCGKSVHHYDLKQAKAHIHAFPKREPDIIEKWKQFAGMPDDADTSKAVICTMHFREEDIIRRPFRVGLKRTAVPCLLPPSSFKRGNEPYAEAHASQEGATQGEGSSNGDEASTELQGVCKGDVTRTSASVSDRENIEESLEIDPLSSAVNNDRLLKPLKTYIYKEQLMENMKNKLCRICGTKQEVLTLIFDKSDEPDENTLSLPKKIEMYLPLELGTHKNLPPKICEKCHDLVESWHELHVACLAADSVLRKMFKEEVEPSDEGDERYENIPSYSSFQGDSLFSLTRSLLINIKNEDLEEMQLNTQRENYENLYKNIHVQRDHIYCAKRIKTEICFKELPPPPAPSSPSPSSPPFPYLSSPPPLSPRSSSPPLPPSCISYKCRHCGEMFASKGECIFHRELCATEPAICDKCGTIVSKRCHLKKHIAVHHESCICKVCGEELKGRESLKIHKKAIHSKKKKLSDLSCPPRVIAYRICKHCSKTFATTEECKKHKIQCGSEPAMCDICGQKFSKRFLLKKHVTNQHLISTSHESHVCQVCGKRLGSRESLRTHYNVHTGERYFCEPCCRVFTNKLCHKNHQKLHEKGVVLVRCLNFQINITADDGGKMKCTCPVCGQSFPDKMSLISHMNEKKRKRCRKCKEILFNERQSLSHNCRQWVCRFCKRHLYCRGDLRVHERRHTGEKPYRCQVCDAKFASSRQLGNHRLKHKSAFLVKCAE